MRKLLIITIASFLLSLGSYAQTAVGQWSSYLPNRSGYELCVAKDRVFCRTELGFMEYVRGENILNSYSRIHKMADVEVTKMHWDPVDELLLLAYQGGNIDLFKKGEFSNIPDLYNNPLTGDKNIYSIYQKDDLVYLGTGFGILVFSPERREFLETWYIGENAAEVQVNKMVELNGRFYVATPKGVRSAPSNAGNLIDYNAWRSEPQLGVSNNVKDLVVFDGRLIAIEEVNDTQFNLYSFEAGLWNSKASGLTGELGVLKVHDDKLYFLNDRKLLSYDKNFMQINKKDKFAGHNTEAFIRDFDFVDNSMWFADGWLALVLEDGSSEAPYFSPNSPYSKGAFDIAARNNQVYVARGSFDLLYTNQFEVAQVNVMTNNNWSAYTNWNKRDYVKVVIDPNDVNRMYVSSWGNGVDVYQDGKLETSWTEANSSLNSLDNSDANIRVSAMEFDQKGNLWFGMTSVQQVLAVKTPEDKWKRFKVSPFGVGRVSDILAHSNGEVWVSGTSGKGIMVYNANKTIEDDSDDTYRVFNPVTSEGESVGSTIYCMSEDKDGAVWIGTDRGISVFNNPNNAISGENFSASRIIIEIDGELGHVLKSETVTDMVVDGGNRKWFATAKSGLYLLSEDAQEEIHHFTTANSPLPSNNIISLGMDDDTGILYIGTDKGLMAYRTKSNEGEDDFNDVYAFPNPVRPNFDGMVTVTGLPYQTDVRITSVSGELVYQTTSLGGQAVWDLRNARGKKVATGVYFIMCNTKDGTKSHITKLLVVN